MISLPYRWIAAALGMLALLAAVWWHGNRAGAREVQASWNAETAARTAQLREDADNVGQKLKISAHFQRRCLAWD